MFSNTRMNCMCSNSAAQALAGVSLARVQSPNCEDNFLQGMRRAIRASSQISNEKIL